MSYASRTQPTKLQRVLNDKDERLRRRYWPIEVLWRGVALEGCHQTTVLKMKLPPMLLQALQLNHQREARRLLQSLSIHHAKAKVLQSDRELTVLTLKLFLNKHSIAVANLLPCRGDRKGRTLRELCGSLFHQNRMQIHLRVVDAMGVEAIRVER